MTELSVSVQSPADGAVIVVTLAGEADITTSRALAEALGSEADKKPPLLIIDVSSLEFIDSAALHVIVQVHRRLHSDGCRLGLVDPARRWPGASAAPPRGIGRPTDSSGSSRSTCSDRTCSRR